jgi:hypothetical protein
MNNNVVNKEVQPRNLRIKIAQGKARMRALLTASTNLSDRLDVEDEALIQRYRDRLTHDKHLLDEPKDRKLCAKLIKLFNIELKAREARAPHERFLQKELG